MELWQLDIVDGNAAETTTHNRPSRPPEQIAAEDQTEDLVQPELSRII